MLWYFLYYREFSYFSILGKYYYEAIIESDGLCRMGWATFRANLNLGDFYIDTF